MSVFTRQNLYQIVRNDSLVKQIAGDDQHKIKTNVNNYVSYLINCGLLFFDIVKDVQEVGRPEHAYTREALNHFNNQYLESVNRHTITLRKAIALAFKKHFDFLDEIPGETREEQLRSYIFVGKN